ncbi:hypothetical protein EVB51_043 [Rhizobium phage RHph_Y17]|uniref:Uncharacterized protein n=2 Tax=Kleczkowskavirus RHEph4 TaxID=1921526 RepID=A0A7S5R4B1_9CAUD|nr:hypothetical protein EVB51_043 [Rhizobium phage RHph_Y17]QIG68979.1 hypothetical protein EVB73_043 [Rhizobium phage RHph_Y3_43]
MADFNPPWANAGERREPTTDEQDNGFGCGPASLPLFNWQFWSIQSELNKIITAAGLTPSNADMTQVWQAIQIMIDASTGGGDPSGYLTMLQARARLPIFPEVLNATGHFGVVSPGTGQVRVPSGVNFQHRGIYPVTTVQTDLATDPSKIYHLRWNPTDGFALKDLASLVYNPTAAAETDSRFDTTYDDMLVARVVTNSSNVPTITNLINRDRIHDNYTDIAAPTSLIGANGANRTAVVTFNYARTPKTSVHFYSIDYAGEYPAGSGDQDQRITETLTRYQDSIVLMYDFSTSIGIKVLAVA